VIGIVEQFEIGRSLGIAEPLEIDHSLVGIAEPLEIGRSWVGIAELEIDRSLVGIAESWLGTVDGVHYHN